jgi:hypothetical protein
MKIEKGQIREKNIREEKGRFRAGVERSEKRREKKMKYYGTR